jgi:hypothetical protein
MRVQTANQRSSDDHFFCDLISAIESEQIIDDQPSAAWPGLLAALELHLTVHPEHCNDDQLISALMEFITKFSDQTALALIVSCCDASVGCSHSFWFSVIALKHERLGNYVKCHCTFKKGIAVRAEPLLFLMHEFSNFKTRMRKRLSGHSHFDLGDLDGVIYTFCAGSVVCLLNGLQMTSEFDFLSEIGFALDSEYEIELGYDSLLLECSNGADRCFEEARLESLRFDYVSARTANRPQRLFPVPIGPRRRTGSNVVGTDLLGTKLTRMNSSPKHLMVGEAILMAGNRYYIQKVLGTTAYLCFNKFRVVVKSRNENWTPFVPENEELFCLPIVASDVYYVTRYREFGNFHDFVAATHDMKIGREMISWYALLQLLRILSNLESCGVCHGDISCETLWNRFGSDELPKQFDLNGKWKGDGFALCRCDKVRPMRDSRDRFAIAALFCRLATNQELNMEWPALPQNWKNGQLWRWTYRVLISGHPLDELIAKLVDMMRCSAVSLRSWKSRINNRIYDRLAPQIV